MYLYSTWATNGEGEEEQASREGKDSTDWTPVRTGSRGRGRVEKKDFPTFGKGKGRSRY